MGSIASKFGVFICLVACMPLVVPVKVGCHLGSWTLDLETASGPCKFSAKPLAAKSGCCKRCASSRDAGDRNPSGGRQSGKPCSGCPTGDCCYLSFASVNYIRCVPPQLTGEAVSGDVAPAPSSAPSDGRPFEMLRPPRV